MDPMRAEVDFIPCDYYYYFFIKDGRGGSGGRDHTRGGVKYLKCYLVIIAELGLGPWAVGVMVHVTCDQRQKAMKHFYYLLDPHQEFLASH